jgi:hypothetical protein
MCRRSHDRSAARRESCPRTPSCSSLQHMPIKMNANDDAPAGARGPRRTFTRRTARCFLIGFLTAAGSDAVAGPACGPRLLAGAADHQRGQTLLTPPPPGAGGGTGFRCRSGTLRVPPPAYDNSSWNRCSSCDGPSSVFQLALVRKSLTFCTRIQQTA